MTCASIDSRPIRSSRVNSRSTSLRASGVSSRSSSFSRSSSRSPPLSSSPSSRRICLSCSRRNISRCRSPSSSCTWDLMSSWASRTEICRCTWTSTRRSRSSTDRVSSSAWRSGGLMSRYPATRSANLPGSWTPGEHLLDDLLGQPGLLTQFAGAGPCLAVETDEGRVLRIERLHLLGLQHDGLEVAVLLSHMHGDATTLAVQQELHAREATLHLADAGDGADGEETLGVDRLHILPLGHGEDQPVRGGEGRLDGAKRSGPTGADWRGGSGEQHDFAQGKDGEYQTLGRFRHLSSLQTFWRIGRTAGERHFRVHPMCHGAPLMRGARRFGGLGRYSRGAAGARGRGVARE